MRIVRKSQKSGGGKSRIIAPVKGQARRPAQQQGASWSFTHHRYCCLLRGGYHREKKSNCEVGSVYLKELVHKSIGNQVSLVTLFRNYTFHCFKSL